MIPGSKPSSEIRNPENRISGITRMIFSRGKKPYYSQARCSTCSAARFLLLFPPYRKP